MATAKIDTEAKAEVGARVRVRVLWSMREASRELGVSRHVVSVLVAVDAIPTHPISTNGRARGLDRGGMRRLRRGVARYLADRDRQAAGRPHRATDETTR